MKNQLNIPSKINVGFQLREGTYTGLLAYVIYWDNKGKLRKENSWNSWRHKPEQEVYISWRDEEGKYQSKREKAGDRVTPQAFENVPTEGFVLNKGVGGQRESWGWNARNEYIRVYDPRGFEFEISVANLLFILQNTSAIKGKGLEGEFVYAWEGKDLILLPVDCYEYRASTEYTDLQSMKITAKDMVPGHAYLTKAEKEVVYVGRYNWYEWKTVSGTGYRYYRPKALNINKKHIFYNVDSGKFYAESGFTKLAKATTDAPVDNYAEIMEKFSNTEHAHEPNTLVEKEVAINFYDTNSRGYYYRGLETLKGMYAIKNNDGSYTTYRIGVERSQSGWNRERTIIGYTLVPVHDITHKNTIRMVGSSATANRTYSKTEIEALPFVKLSLSLSNGKELELSSKSDY